MTIHLQNTALFKGSNWAISGLPSLRFYGGTGVLLNCCYERIGFPRVKGFFPRVKGFGSRGFDILHNYICLKYFYFRSRNHPFYILLNNKTVPDDGFCRHW